MTASINQPDYANDFEAYLAIAPALTCMSAEERLIAVRQCDLDETAWAVIEIEWAQRFFRDLDRGDLSRAARFGRACADARKARERTSSQDSTLLDERPEGSRAPALPFSCAPPTATRISVAGFGAAPGDGSDGETSAIPIGTAPPVSRLPFRS